ncbi:LacI family transcriptional regulator [Thermocatellispora tengchongensis]|uniref:LacI family transcriptional regulator n=1 Tax=Thermocatellispora tengchongensis TaxID=1073253 RepID=A0A840PQY9_9ACTN|nr:LacI family DNA-binding transcriptional regulator [Thermocatellispora tengchongensis]MBB5140200.1 LacI family transcriptional regulator [Thermocatellispora tengchongensis]
MATERAGASGRGRTAGAGRRTADDRVTIAMVARAAGVSVPTVSKVLNGRDAVGPETRRRVEDALIATGYQRRSRAEAGRSGLVDFMIGGLDSAWACELLRGAEQEAYRLGARLVLTATHDGQERPREWLQSASRPTDGVVLVVSGKAGQAVAERLRSIDVPFVVIDQVGGYDRDVPTIGATNWAGGFAATEHLTGLGHRRIGMITGPMDVQCSLERLDGYRAALGRAGIAPDETLVRHGDHHAESGRRAAAELFDLPDPPTAVFAGCDEQAAGVYEEAHARGLRIPGDLSVVGFDDVDMCRWMTPRLTTIRQPLAQMAALAVRNVLETAHTPGEQPLRLELSTTLVVRESTAPPGPRPPRPGLASS